MTTHQHRIAKVGVHLVSSPVPAGFADATRTVETIGFTVVRITTDQGLEGFGLTYHEVGGEATRSLILHNIAPRIIGRDPLDTEVLWEELFHYLRGVGRKGLTYCALSAVDLALWDLKGKIIGLPLYRLLGGGKTRLPVYASGGWTSYDDDQLVDEMVGMVGEGYSHIKFKVGVDNARNLNRDLARVRKVREAVGPDIRLLIDANNCWDAGTAIKFADRAKEFDIYLFEEPVLADDIPGLARVRRGTSIPLATGEHEYTKYGARDLILGEAADIIQLDGARAGGMTEMLKIGALTQAWNLKFAPHAMEHMHMHIVSVMPNALFLERLRIFEDVSNKIVRNAPLPKDGFIEIPTGPGHGLELDMDFIAEFDETKVTGRP
jgi:L-alanine-DL-glutamate epimerase-like enolase superfamily enzyme